MNADPARNVNHATVRNMNKSEPCRPGEIGHAETQRIDGQERMFSPSVRDRLVRLAYRFVWNLEDAEDVAHEALSKVFEQKKDLRQSDKWWSWTCRIVVRACHEHGRRKARRARHEPSVGYETARRECEPVGSDESEQKVQPAGASISVQVRLLAITMAPTSTGP